MAAGAALHGRPNGWGDGCVLHRLGRRHQRRLGPFRADGGGGGGGWGVFPPEWLSRPINKEMYELYHVLRPFCRFCKRP